MLLSINKKKYSSRLKTIFISLSMVLTITFLSSCSTNQVEITTSASVGPISYSQDVVPILTNRCIKCHGNDKQEGQLDLSSYAAIMAGGKSGDVISPGNADNSKLISLVTSGKMPKKGAKLNPDQVKILMDWVNAGAQDN